MKPAKKVTAAGLERRAQELREAAATRRLTSPERAELNDIVARAEAARLARAAKAAKARRAKRQAVAGDG